MPMMISCREVTRLVSEGLDRKLGFGERIALRAHFMMCRGCENARKQIEFLRDAVQQLSATEDDRPA